MNSREALGALKTASDNIRQSLCDPQSGGIVKGRNRGTLDAMLLRFTAQEIAEIVVAHMTARDGSTIAAHFLDKAMGRK